MTASAKRDPRCRLAELALPWNALRMHRAITPGIWGQTFANSRHSRDFLERKSGPRCQKSRTHTQTDRQTDRHTCTRAGIMNSWSRTPATLSAIFHSFSLLKSTTGKDCRGREREINRECHAKARQRRVFLAPTLWKRSIDRTLRAILISWQGMRGRGKFYSHGEEKSRGSPGFR